MPWTTLPYTTATMARLLRASSADGALAASAAPTPHRPPAHARSASFPHLLPTSAEWPPLAARPPGVAVESEPDVLAWSPDSFDDVPASQATLFQPDARPPSSKPIAVAARRSLSAEPAGVGADSGASDQRPVFTWQQPRADEELPSPGRTKRALALRDLVLRASGFIEEDGAPGRR
jgi:hypothetical protein